MKSNIIFGLYFMTVMCACNLAVLAKAQETSVAKSNWGVQIGVPIISIYHESKLFDSNRDPLDNSNPTNGIMFYNELKLTDKIVLKTEGGLGGYFRAYNHVRLLLTPTIAIEPRFYITKPQLLQINNNMGNFIGININYNPNLFNLQMNWPNAITSSAISIAPFYALKGPIGKNFHYEIGGGMGYLWRVGQAPYDFDTTGLHFIVQLRLGYTFLKK